jgi:hypothetical protein
MGKEDLIVDNPLLLTSLFGKGIFAIPDEGNGVKTPANPNPKSEQNEEVSATPLVSIPPASAAQIPAESEQNEDVSATPLVSIPPASAAQIPAESEQNEDVSATPLVSIPPVEVIHIVVETGNSPYKTETIPNAMNALGKLLNNKVPSFVILDVSELAIDIDAYVQLVPPSTKIVLWAAESPESQKIKSDSNRILILSMPSVMLSSQERKADHWNRIKAFFI